MKKYKYFYKITNNINGKYYYGVHCTDNINDGYMGSGTRIKPAYKKYGIENFTKEIISFFDTTQELYEYERTIVNEDLIKDDNCYNIKLGGEQFDITGLVQVLQDDKIILIPKTDKRWLNQELQSPYKNKTIVKNINDETDIKIVDCNNIPENYVGIRKNRVTVFDKNNNKISIDTKNENYINGTYTHINTGYVTIKNDDNTYSRIRTTDFYNGSYVGMFKDTIVIVDENGINKRVSIYNEKYINGEYKTPSHNIGIFKDKQNNIIRCRVDDERVLSGELVGHTKGYKMHKNTRKAIRERMLNSIYINNGKINKLIKQNELEKYLNEGWIKGMIKGLHFHTEETKQKISNKQKELVAITNGKENTKVHFSIVDDYIKQGWRKGITRFNKKKTGIKVWVNNGLQQTYINKTELDTYITNGWQVGMIKRKKIS